MDDLKEVSQCIKAAGGTFHNIDDAEIAIENAEHKYRDPFGVVIDVSTLGRPGARNNV